MSAPSALSSNSGELGTNQVSLPSSLARGSSTTFKVAKHPPAPGTAKKIGPPVPRNANQLAPHTVEPVTCTSTNDAVSSPVRSIKPGNGKMFGSPVDPRFVDIATGRKLFSLPSTQEAAVLQSSADDYDEDAEAIVFVPPTVVQYARRLDDDDYERKSALRPSVQTEADAQEVADAAVRHRLQRRAEREESLISLLVEGRHADALAMKGRLSDSDDEERDAFAPSGSSKTTTALLSSVLGTAGDDQQAESMAELIAQL